MPNLIPLARPDVGFDEVAGDIKTILESGILTRGAYVARFEEEVASYTGCKYAIATTSATTALHLSLVAAGIGVGDEVLVSDFTFPASGNAIVQTGAKPVLVDCLPGRFEIDVEQTVKMITPKTKAIMVVHPFGHPADMPRIAKIASERNLTVIEDAACAIGSEIDGRRCGSWGSAGCFSFHPRKILTTGEGGMITTNDEAFAAKARLLATHGGTTGPAVGLAFVENGYNYRMSEIQAALGLAQLNRLNDMLADRRRIAARYRDALSGAGCLHIPDEIPNSQCTYQSFVVMLDKKVNRDVIVKNMRNEGIETTLGTYAMHAHPAFSRFGYKPGDLPHSHAAQQRSLTLPLLPRMKEEDINFVSNTLINLLSS